MGPVGASADVALRSPINGAACCACAEKGIAAALPINAINSRRLMLAPKAKEAIS